ncbi:MAG: N-acetylmuramoyl-L-alanine amidase [Ruminococcus sp.]|jgi:N-acetylmuramoyl-L-alanine amidase|nr:N-acetylmuramoyl-L-alanine amidase [Ruminococcus sp.]
MRNFKKRIAAFLTAVCMVLPLLPSMVVYAETDEGLTVNVIEKQPDVIKDEDLPVYTEPVYTPMFSLQNDMRGIYITPESDFPLIDPETGERLTEEAIAENVAAVLDNAELLKLNAVIINTSADNTYFSTDVNEGIEKSVIEYVINPAKERGMSVYLNFNIDRFMSSLSEAELGKRIDQFALGIRNFTIRYPVDGIIFDGYYAEKDSQSLSDYLDFGSGIGYSNWLSDNAAYVFSLAASAVHKSNNTVPVGISLSDVWANYTTAENGSETEADFEALTDGYADTVSYINNHYADFLILKTKGSIGDSTTPFNSITKWWDGIAAVSGSTLYVVHSNEKICTEATGWGSPDELVKQVIAASSLSSYGGSAYNSLQALVDDQMESTNALMLHYENKIDVEGLNSELEMTLPKSTTFKTEEPTVIFAGSFDPNFPVYYQGEEIKLNEAGRFYFQEDLDVGINTFKFQNKSKVITYTITRTVDVIKSIAPIDPEIFVDGESTVQISAIAYKGSAVSASVNGKSISLKESTSQTDAIDPNSGYALFTAYYTVPKGKIGAETDLGTISVYGKYQAKKGSFEKTMTGSRIYINALAPETQAFDGSILRVKSDNTITYRANTTSTAPTPDSVRLPAGTLDYYVRAVTLDGTKYYVTNSGKRLRASAVDVLENAPMGANPISVIAAGTAGGDTVIEFGLAKKIPYSLVFNGSSYGTGDNGNYYVESFDASSVSIIFDYVTSVSSAGDINFSGGSVFTSGKWDTYESNGLYKTRLTLGLSSRGAFRGFTATYNDSGNLVMSFNSVVRSLSGATIVIDPGHGYTGASEFDPGAVGHIKEQTANLAIAKYLESYLSNAGANVVRLRSESETYVTEQRASIARQYKPDLFVSVHCNAASGGSAFGTEVYYFTPYSQPLASKISAQIAGVLNNLHGGSGSNRGAKYNYFFVTQQQDFPSVLIETAFVTNYDEAMALADSAWQKRFAKAIMTGIENFLAG